MDIALGVSMTPTTVRMVLVEGERADGVTVDHDVFTISADEGTEGAPERVIAAILGTRESALEGGHNLVSTGITWSDHASAAVLRDALKTRGIDDVLLVSELHAAGALATAAGGALDYQRTALMFLERDTATLAVVDNSDGSIVKVQREQLHSADAVAELGAMLAGLETLESPPDGIFVVGSGVDVAAIKLQLEAATSLPVNAPDEPGLALARGAALAGTQAPLFEAATAGLAYALASEGVTSGSPAAVTQVAGAEYRGQSQLAYSAVDDEDDESFVASLAAAGAELDADEATPAENKPFLLVGSALATVFVVGIGALAISLAVTIRPTSDQRPGPADRSIVPAEQVQAAEPPAAEPPAAVPAPPVKPAPEPVAEKVPAPQRAVQLKAPVPQAPAPAPAAPAPAPAAPAPVPDLPVVVPAAVPEPPVAVVPAPAAPAPAPAAPAPAPAAPAPVAPAPQAPAPAYVPAETSPPTGFFPGQSPQQGAFNPGGQQSNSPYNPFAPRQQYPQQQYPSYPQYPQQQYPQQRQQQQQYPSRSDYDFDRGSSKRGSRNSNPGLPFLPWPFGHR